MFLRYFDRFRIFSMIAACFAGISSTHAVADDWPGWMGPSRDGIYRETGIIDAVPDSGLTVKWRTPIAGGYAGPAVADGRVFVFDYKKTAGEAFNDAGKRANLKGQERLTALDAETGKPLWQHAYDCPYSISYPAGPRCTPTVDGDLVYILGSEGDLRALRVADGEVVWKRNLPKDLGAEVPIWGFAAHPLIDGDTLYTMVGGQGQSIVAFDKLTGDVKWKAIDDSAGYCTPSIIQHGGARQLIVYHPTAVTSLNPATGSQYWSIPITPSFEMSIARPMVDGNLMYASGIRSESLMIQLENDRPAAKELWRGEPKEAVHSANATPIFTGGVVYGTDCVVGQLIAVDAKDGSRLWETFEATKPDEKRFIKHGTAFLTRLADSDRYLIFSETGDLQMAKLTPDGYEDLGRFHVLEPTGEAFGRPVVWSHPAYAGQTAFARNDKEVVAVDLAK
ncbi:PQQ-binding-like beta-propeller repeat protein [Novipirellula caenicola]|uniref:Outer membrane protein assembly factor BamB n=1 Tax=Novipirellula caenicola TaxID=1536901 RepID=A0ABP9VUX0_9BACT